MTTTLYETDFYAWTKRQAALLRGEEFEQIDWNNLIAEIESLGRSEKHEVESRLTVILMHLLKWQYQPSKRSTGRSWRKTLTIQRIDLDSKSQPTRPATCPSERRVYTRCAQGSSRDWTR